MEVNESPRHGGGEVKKTHMHLVCSDLEGILDLFEILELVYGYR
jgi:hypothetical protein